MADYLIEFIEGQTIYASEHNSNNNFILDQIKDNSSVLNTKITNVQANCSTAIENAKNDLQSKIDEMQENAYTPDKSSLEQRKTVIGWAMPDYTAGISVPRNTNFTCQKDGWVLINDIRTNNGYMKITINGSTYNFTDSGGNYHNTDFAIIPVSKNDVINFTGLISIFYPAKGEV